MEKPHKKLDVWRLAMDLVTAVYQVTEKFPREERYSLSRPKIVPLAYQPADEVGRLAPPR
jgi:hypothetical protein